VGSPPPHHRFRVYVGVYVQLDNRDLETLFTYRLPGLETAQDKLQALQDLYPDYKISRKLQEILDPDEVTTQEPIEKDHYEIYIRIHETRANTHSFSSGYCREGLFEPGIRFAGCDWWGRDVADTVDAMERNLFLTKRLDCVLYYRIVYEGLAPDRSNFPYQIVKSTQPLWLPDEPRDREKYENIQDAQKAAAEAAEQNSR